MSLKVGEILVKQGLVSPEIVGKALDEQKKNGGKLTAVIMTLSGLSETQILRALEKHYQVPGVDLSKFEVPANLLQLVQREICEKHLILPVQQAGQTLVMAFADPSNLVLREDLRYITKLKIQPVVSTTVSIANAIEKFYGGSSAAKTIFELSAQQAEEGESEALPQIEVIDQAGSDDAPVVKYVNLILAEAIRKKASDIHFEPYEKVYRTRLRIDGGLIATSAPPANLTSAISSRLKIMAKLDISERRRPQDGRIKIKLANGKEMDFRVNTLPTLWGEKIVLRLLDKSNLQLDMTKLGFEQDDLDIFQHSIHLPQGMVLITGPTGSGKTTTIYSALAELNQPDVNISTAEDPVEFNLEGINQVQMNPEIDLNFSTALKAFLRQDPDIVMVGEIRDLETAEIAFKAASTGHLVVSTLHTNDAPSTVTRLREMGIPTYLITSTVALIVAQRLVGKICENCKETIEVTRETLLDLGVVPEEIPDYKVCKGRGCNVCNNTGIKGRLAIYELLTMPEKVKEAILANASVSQLRGISHELGLRTLRRSALLKLKRGMTTIEEVVNASVKDVQ